jgi:hypothetical protein
LTFLSQSLSLGAAPFRPFDGALLWPLTGGRGVKPWTGAAGT